MTSTMSVLNAVQMEAAIKIGGTSQERTDAAKALTKTCLMSSFSYPDSTPNSNRATLAVLWADGNVFINPAQTDLWLGDPNDATTVGIKNKNYVLPNNYTDPTFWTRVFLNAAINVPATKDATIDFLVPFFEQAVTADTDATLDVEDWETNAVDDVIDFANWNTNKKELVCRLAPRRANI